MDDVIAPDKFLLSYRRATAFQITTLYNCGEQKHIEHYLRLTTTAETTSGSTPVSQEQKCEAAVTQPHQH